MAVGDGANDFELVAHAGIGVAMGNAVPRVSVRSAFASAASQLGSLLSGACVFRWQHPSFGAGASEFALHPETFSPVPETIHPAPRYGGQVKQAAQFVTSSNDEDGIAEAFEKYVL